MGAMTGTIRGKTQGEVFKKYSKARRQEKARGLMEDLEPSSRADCYAAMDKDESTGEWELRFRWHT